MVASVTGRKALLASGKAAALTKGSQRQQRVIDEACAEAEYNLNPGAASTGARMQVAMHACILAYHEQEFSATV